MAKTLYFLCNRMHRHQWDEKCYYISEGKKTDETMDCSIETPTKEIKKSDS